VPKQDRTRYASQVPLVDSPFNTSVFRSDETNGLELCQMQPSLRLKYVVPLGPRILRAKGDSNALQRLSLEPFCSGALCHFAVSITFARFRSTNIIQYASGKSRRLYGRRQTGETWMGPCFCVQDKPLTQGRTAGEQSQAQLERFFEDWSAPSNTLLINHACPLLRGLSSQRVKDLMNKISALNLLISPRSCRDWRPAHIQSSDLIFEDDTLPSRPSV
jgi:hypothetical protein